MNHSLIRKCVLLLNTSTYEEREKNKGEKRVKTRREFGKRRQNDDMPSFPFMDDHGVLVKENRRKIPDRRIAQITPEQPIHADRG